MSISGCRLWYFVSPKIHSGPISCNLKIARTAIPGLRIARVNGVKMLCNGGPALDDLEVQLLVYWSINATAMCFVPMSDGFRGPGTFRIGSNLRACCSCTQSTSTLTCRNLLMP